MHVTVTGCLPVLFLLATIISDLITEFKGHGHVPHLSEYQSWLPTTAENDCEASRGSLARGSSNRTYMMHVRKDSTRIAGAKPHQPRYPSRPSALVRSNAHDYQRGTPVRCYDARDCPEATLELRIPSHTALSGSRPAEVLLAVPRAHSSLTPSRSASSNASACGRAMCQNGARFCISGKSGAARRVSFGTERGNHGPVKR